MKICQPHWDRLVQAIKDRGMWHLVAASGEIALENMKDDLEGKETPFDPLISCNNMIWSEGLNAGGLYLMTADLCPICEAIEHRKDVVEPDLGRPFTKEEEESWWIDGPTNACLAHCQELGLVPKVQ